MDVCVRDYRFHRRVGIGRSIDKSMEMLIAARVLQGAGGGMLTPVSTTMLVPRSLSERTRQGVGRALDSDHNRASDGTKPDQSLMKPVFSGLS